MSAAPSETGCYDSFATNLQDKTEPVTSTQHALGATTALAVHSAHDAQAAGSGDLTDALLDERPTNPPLGVTDLTLRFIDGTPIRKNRIPLHNETPIQLTVKFTNKPDGVDEMIMNVIISQLSKDSYRRGKSGSFSKYVNSTTYEDTVPIVPEAIGYSITTQIGHAQAPSGGFHGGDGPYDVFMSFAPAGTGVHEEGKSAAAEQDHEDDGDDDEYSSQIEETLRYTFYNPDIHLLGCMYYALWRFWDGLLARLYYAVWRFWDGLVGLRRG